MELPPAPPRLVRKSAYGRTQLFLPSTSAVLREVKCMGGITRHDTANVYHTLPHAHETASACWHCAEPIPAHCPTAIPLPRLYDPDEKLYHVYGRTCSPGCAKAHVLETTTFDRGQHLNTLVKMLREVYGVTQPVVAAPPRAALRRWGGAFDPRNQPRAECRLVAPPFVSYCMIVEERAAEEQLPTAPEEADTLDEPPPPGLFADYVRTRQQQPPPSATSTTTTAPPSKASSSSQPPQPPQKRRREAGPLARFVRSK